MSDLHAFGDSAAGGSGPCCRRAAVLLGTDFEGKTLALRIYSEHLNIGFYEQPRTGVLQQPLVSGRRGFRADRQG